MNYICSPEEVIQAKSENNVLDCAYFNPSENAYNVCGNNTQAYCNVEESTLKPSFSILYRDGDSSDSDHQIELQKRDFNFHDSLNCKNSNNFNIDDHENLYYDIELIRFPRFFLQTLNSEGEIEGLENCENTQDCDIKTILSNLKSNGAVPIYYNDDDGGNALDYFNNNSELLLDVSFLPGIYDETKYYKIESKDKDSSESEMNISDVLTVIKYNLNLCSMQPTDVVAILDDFKENLPDEPDINFVNTLHKFDKKISEKPDNALLLDACEICSTSDDEFNDCKRNGASKDWIISCFEDINEHAKNKLSTITSLTDEKSHSNRLFVFDKGSFSV